LRTASLVLLLGIFTIGCGATQQVETKDYYEYDYEVIEEEEEEEEVIEEENDSFIVGYWETDCLRAPDLSFGGGTEVRPYFYTRSQVIFKSDGRFDFVENRHYSPTGCNEDLNPNYLGSSPLTSYVGIIVEGVYEILADERIKLIIDKLYSYELDRTINEDGTPSTDTATFGTYYFGELLDRLNGNYYEDEHDYTLSENGNEFNIDGGCDGAAYEDIIFHRMLDD